MNVATSGTDAAGSINVCTFDFSISLTAGVTGNYFEGQGSPSPWTGTDVEVQVLNHTSNTKTKILGAVRIAGCRVNFKDNKVLPPVIIARSLMQSAWKESGIIKSLLFTSHDGSQTVRIVDKASDNRDDTWPFFCQVRSPVFVVLSHCTPRFNLRALR